MAKSRRLRQFEDLESDGNERPIRRKKIVDVPGLYIGRLGECPDTEEDIADNANRQLRRLLDPNG